MRASAATVSEELIPLGDFGSIDSFERDLASKSLVAIGPSAGVAPGDYSTWFCVAQRTRPDSSKASTYFGTDLSSSSAAHSFTKQSAGAAVESSASLAEHLPKTRSTAVCSLLDAWLKLPKVRSGWGSLFLSGFVLRRYATTECSVVGCCSALVGGMLGPQTVKA